MFLQALIEASRSEREEGGGSAGWREGLGKLLVWGAVLCCLSLLAVVLTGVAREGRLPIFSLCSHVPEVIICSPCQVLGGTGRCWRAIFSGALAVKRLYLYYHAFLNSSISANMVNSKGYNVDHCDVSLLT